MLDGRADAALLETYDAERTFGTDENILNSTRSTKFMTPADGAERMFRDQVLALAAKAPFARSWVNSGRLSVPCVYPTDSANDPAFPAVSQPGAVMPDAPQGNGWLIERTGGRVVILAFDCEVDGIEGAEVIRPVITKPVRDRFLGDLAHAVYVIRPDQVVAGRWPYVDRRAIRACIDTIWGRK